MKIIQGNKCDAQIAILLASHPGIDTVYDCDENSDIITVALKPGWKISGSDTLNSITGDMKSILCALFSRVESPSGVKQAKEVEYLLSDCVESGKWDNLAGFDEWKLFINSFKGMVEKSAVTVEKTAVINVYSIVVIVILAAALTLLYIL